MTSRRADYERLPKVRPHRTEPARPAGPAHHTPPADRSRPRQPRDRVALGLRPGSASTAIEELLKVCCSVSAREKPRVARAPVILDGLRASARRGGGRGAAGVASGRPGARAVRIARVRMLKRCR